MKVSILMPAFNHERYIARAIESVQAQTYSNWELIVWDDGSKDATLAIARAFEKKDPRRIRVFSHEGSLNRGQEETRNCAMRVATGDLFGLLDSDDWYLPRKLELLVPLFFRGTVGLAYGEALFAKQGHAGEELVPSGISTHPEGRVLETLLRENFICAGATLFRRQCMESCNIVFDSRYRTIGEYPVWISIARTWEFATVRTPVSVWRSHGENLGSRLAVQAKKELVDLNMALLKDASMDSYRDVLEAALYQRLYDYGCELYASVGVSVSESELKLARDQFWSVATASGASVRLRGKAMLLGLLSFGGADFNQVLAEWKRRRWESSRHQNG